MLLAELVRILAGLTRPTFLAHPLDSIALLSATKVVQMTTYLGIEEFSIYHWSFFRTHPELVAAEYSPFYLQLRSEALFSSEELALESEQRHANSVLLSSLRFGDPDEFQPVPSLGKLREEILSPELLQQLRKDS